MGLSLNSDSRNTVNVSSIASDWKKIFWASSPQVSFQRRLVPHRAFYVAGVDKFFAHSSRFAQYTLFILNTRFRKWSIVWKVQARSVRKMVLHCMYWPTFTNIRIRTNSSEALTTVFRLFRSVGRRWYCTDNPFKYILNELKPDLLSRRKRGGRSSWSNEHVQHITASSGLTAEWP